MSEEAKKEARTINQIQAEFNNGCARSGQIKYQIVCLEKELGILMESLKDLNLEAVSITAKEVEAKKEESK